MEYLKKVPWKRQRNRSIKPKIQRLQLDVTLSKIYGLLLRQLLGPSKDREVSEDPKSYVFESFTFFLKPFESINIQNPIRRLESKILHCGMDCTV